jgi:hypothetical protein
MRRRMPGRRQSAAGAGPAWDGAAGVGSRWAQVIDVEVIRKVRADLDSA